MCVVDVVEDHSNSFGGYVSVRLVVIAVESQNVSRFVDEDGAGRDVDQRRGTGVEGRETRCDIAWATDVVMGCPTEELSARLTKRVVVVEGGATILLVSNVANTWVCGGEDCGRFALCRQLNRCPKR